MARKKVSPQKEKAVYLVCAVIGIITLILCVVVAIVGIGNIEDSPRQDEASVVSKDLKEPTVEGWTNDVPAAAQMVLNAIAEDMAKQAVKNPFTVDMKSLTTGFAKNGHLYAVQSEFECANLMGVTEIHTIRVICESNEDESKIQPCEVWIDGVLVATHDGYESEVDR